MKIIKQNVGIDIAKKNFKACYMQQLDGGKLRIKGSKTFQNTLSGFKSLVEWVQKHNKTNQLVHLTMEATGVYYEELAYYLYEQTDFYVSVILANKFKAYAKSLNIKSKTDKMDARILGQMGIERNLRQWKPICPQMRQLKQLTRERVRMLEHKTMVTNQLEALNYSHHPLKESIKRLEQQIEQIEKHLKQVESEIDAWLEEQPDLKQKVENICEMKGLRWRSVAIILAETDGFNLFTNRAQLVSFAGYDVVQRESGTSVKGKTRISKKGNRFIRRALYWPAIGAVKGEPIFKQFFERIVKRSGNKMIAYVAVQRKVLLLIYTLFKKNQPYDPNYQKKLEQSKIQLVTV